MANMQLTFDAAIQAEQQRSAAFAQTIATLNTQGQALEQTNANLLAEGRLLEVRLDEARRSAVPPSSSPPRPRDAPPPRVRVIAPSTFKGSNDERPHVLTWLFSVDIYFTASRVDSDEDKIKLFPTLLEGDALTWWMYLASDGSRFTTFKQLTTLFRNHFEPINVTDNVRASFASLRHTHSVQIYAGRFKQFILQLPDISTAAALHQFIHHLKPAIRTQVQIAAPPSLEAAISMAERVDTISNNGASSHQSYPPRYAAGSSSHYRGAQPMDLGALPEDPPGYAWEDLSLLDQLDIAEPAVYDQVAALLSANRSSSSRLPSGRFPSNRPSRSPLSLQQREQARLHGLCFHCLSKDHAITDCPSRPPPQ